MMPSRSERFLARVDFERAVLGVVNASTACRDVPLAGLSTGAISNWRNRALAVLPKNLAYEISNVLEDASRKAGLMADNSRIAIDPEFVSKPENLNRTKSKLEEILRSPKSSGEAK